MISLYFYLISARTPQEINTRLLGMEFDILFRNFSQSRHNTRYQTIPFAALMRRYRVGRACNRKGNITACFLRWSAHKTHNQYINNKCQMTSHKSQHNGKQSTLCSCKDVSTFNNKGAELKAMAVGKKSRLRMSLTRAFPPWLTMPHCQYYPPPLCDLPREIPRWHSLTQRKNMSTEISGTTELRVTCKRGWLLAILRDSCRQKLNFFSCSGSFTTKALGDRKLPALPLWNTRQRQTTRAVSVYLSTSLYVSVVLVYILPLSFITERKLVWGMFSALIY